MILVKSTGHLVVQKIVRLESILEIRRNLIGYEKLATRGLRYLTPEIISSSLDWEWGHILMEDCGTDFAAMLRNDQVSSKTYDLFMAELLKVYQTSVGEGSDSDIHVDSQVSVAKNLYNNFFQTQFGSPELDSAMKELRGFFPRRIKRFCFSSWDFMPGNIFLDDASIKFVDPTECVTGVPIIDLACLGGALQDVYHHPDAQLWRKGFKSLALGPVAQLLDLGKKEAEQIYLLGRLVQTFLNLRVVLQQSGDPSVFVVRIKRYINQLALS